MRLPSTIAATPCALALMLGLSSVAMLAAGCSAPAATDDASAIDVGRDAGACTATGCDDGVYCNGTETCVAGACAAGTPPCAAASCDETADHCACTPADADGDGSAAVACGGTDCDDADPLRHPGAPEVCDVAGVDEDCDPSTFGFRDQDGDGAADATCCNHESGDRCGTDCNDQAPGVSPTSPEVCNDLDDDCDAATDEGVRVTCWVDADHDGFALAGATPMQLCACGAGTTATDPATSADCNDGAVAISPAVPEVCGNGVDDDCDGATDVGSAWSPDCDADGFGDPAGATVTSCTIPGTRPPSCSEATPSWSTDARDCNDHVATVRPGANDVCNGVDDDCNAATADGATDPGCVPGAGTCHGGACCRTCWDGTTCQPGTTTSACGAHGGACAGCRDCVACTAGVCSGGSVDGTLCSAGAGRCLAASCCTGCVSGGSCVAGDQSGACGFDGNACSSCAGCDGATATCTGLGGNLCASPVDITLARGASMSIPIDTCGMPSTVDATESCDQFTGGTPAAPPGTPDVVIRGTGGRGYIVEVDPGWTIIDLFAGCAFDSCTQRGWVSASSSSSTLPLEWAVERAAGGCGRVTLRVTGY